MSDEETTTSWDGGWEVTRVDQLRLWARATPAARLAWLEEAIRLAHAAGALPRRRGNDVADPEGLVHADRSLVRPPRGTDQ